MTPDTPDANRSRFTGVFAGIGIGILVGMLLGLSVSEVVGAVVGAIAAMLAAILGLSDGNPFAKGADKGGESQASQASSDGSRWARDARIGSFGIACTLGVLLGLFIRTHDLLGVPLVARVEAWQHAGYSPKQARELVAFEETGSTPNGRADSGSPDGASRKSRTTALYAGGWEKCAALSPDRYAEPAELLNAWDLAGGSWRELAAAIRDESKAPRGLPTAAWRLACEDRE